MLVGINKHMNKLQIGGVIEEIKGKMIILDTKDIIIIPKDMPLRRLDVINCEVDIRSRICLGHPSISLSQSFIGRYLFEILMDKQKVDDILKDYGTLDDLNELAIKYSHSLSVEKFSQLEILVGAAWYQNQVIRALRLFGLTLREIRCLIPLTIESYQMVLNSSPELCLYWTDDIINRLLEIHPHLKLNKEEKRYTKAARDYIELHVKAGRQIAVKLDDLPTENPKVFEMLLRMGCKVENMPNNDSYLYTSKYCLIQNKLVDYMQLSADAYIRKNFDVELDSDACEPDDDNKVYNLDASQCAAIVQAFNNKVFALPGEAGTGKTTVNCGMIKILEEAGIPYSCLAFTGRATAKIREELARFKIPHCSENISTIHRFIFNPPADFSKKKVIIFEESSMIPSVLLFKLLCKIKGNLQLIFVGDVNQLDPVQVPGDVFKCLVASKNIPKFILRHVYRTDDANLYDCFQAILMHTSPKPCASFKMYKILGPRQEYTILNNIFNNQLKSVYNTAIIAPFNAEVEKVNTIVQVYLLENTDKLGKVEAKDRFNRCWHIGDKAMNKINNYDKGIYNGDVGTVISLLDVGGIRVHFKLSTGGITEQDYFFDKRLCKAKYEEDDESDRIRYLDHIESVKLAYSMTVHSAQGSERNEIVILLNRYRSDFITRELLYTAATRTKKVCHLIYVPRFLALLLNRPDVPLMDTMQYLL